MANPPTPVDPPALDAPVTHGTILSYGLEDLPTVTGIIIDSYKRDASFANVDEITNNMGIVSGLRMSDYRIAISISGRVLAVAAPTISVGDLFTANGDTGVITQISLSGEAKGFAKLDFSVTAYQGVQGMTTA
jgi:hypothetical protein